MEKSSREDYQEIHRLSNNKRTYDDEMILDANPHVKGIKQSVQNSSSFATVSINEENLKKLEEALIKFFNNEETSMNTGKIFEDLMQ